MPFLELRLVCTANANENFEGYKTKTELITTGPATHERNNSLNQSELEENTQPMPSAGKHE